VGGCRGATDADATGIPLSGSEVLLSLDGRVVQLGAQMKHGVLTDNHADVRPIWVSARPIKRQVKRLLISADGGQPMVCPPLA
jgi:hypothetical protein